MPASRCDTCVLLVSEVVTNALRHTTGQVMLDELKGVTRRRDRRVGDPHGLRWFAFRLQRSDIDFPGSLTRRRRTDWR